MVKKAKPQKTHAPDCDMDEDCMGCLPFPAPPKAKLLTLEELMALCRRFGVLSIKNAACEGMPAALDIDFAPMLASDPGPVAPSSSPVPASQPEAGVKREAKRGADGLTAEVQEELYMRPMDAER